MSLIPPEIADSEVHDERPGPVETVMGGNAVQDHGAVMEVDGPDIFHDAVIIKTSAAVEMYFFVLIYRYIGSRNSGGSRGIVHHEGQVVGEEVAPGVLDAQGYIKCTGIVEYILRYLFVKDRDIFIFRKAPSEIHNAHIVMAPAPVQYHESMLVHHPVRAGNGGGRCYIPHVHREVVLSQVPREVVHPQVDGEISGDVESEGGRCTVEMLADPPVGEVPRIVLDPHVIAAAHGIEKQFHVLIYGPVRPRFDRWRCAVQDSHPDRGNVPVSRPVRYVQGDPVYSYRVENERW